MSEKLKLGIIGTGWPGQMHARALRVSSIAGVYACADLDDTRRLAFERE